MTRRLVSRWHHDRRENRAENVTIGSVCIEALARRRESVIGVVGRTDAPARPEMRRVLLGEWCHRRPALRKVSVITVYFGPKGGGRGDFKRYNQAKSF